MNKTFAFAVFVLAANGPAAAGPPTHFVFDGGIVDTQRNLVYVSSTGGPAAAASLVPHSHDGRGEHYVANQANAAISALRLTSGKRVWTAKGVLVPMHLYKNKLISYARNENQVVLAVTDVRSGKVLKHFETGIGSSPPKDQGCWPNVHRSSRWWGRRRDFWYSYHVSSCPKRRPQGVRLSHDEVARRMAECTSSDNAVHIDLDALKLKKSDQAQATFSHQTGTESLQDLGKFIVRVEARCAQGTYNCRERTVTLRHFKPDGKTLKWEKVLIEKSAIQTTRLSADGKHVFVPLPAAKDTKELRIFDARTGKELSKKPYPVPQDYNFTAHLLHQGVLIGTDKWGTSGLRLRDMQRLWNFARPSVQGPPCPPVP